MNIEDLTMMKINDHADAVHAVQRLQEQAGSLGLTLVFEERTSQYCPAMLAAVIGGGDGEEHVFYTFTEASAFMQGLAVARHSSGDVDRLV